MFPGVQTMNNYINGGRGGVGGSGYGRGTGGAGGYGMGPSLNFDIQSSGNFTVNNVQQRERGIDILHHAVAFEAIHDSTDSFMEPKCHPETRTKMLKDLSDWAVETHPKTTVFWLYGPAGAGKSAIMRTLAAQLHEDGRLGACFFFKRGHATRGNARTMSTTIAYQLALNVEWLRAPISQVVEQNPSIVARSMTTQMQELISKPCHTLEHHDPIVILIDGLDECDGYGVQAEILHTIRSPFLNHPLFLRFMVASRLEPNIRQGLDLVSSHYCSFNVEQSFDDIRKYLRDEFSRIHRDHSTMQNISSPWPVYHVLEELVRKSSGYFIYASTIIKFIGDDNYHPPQRLAMVQDTSSTGSASPFEVLDQLYLTILGSARRQSELIQIICAIVKLRLVPRSIEQLFGLAQGETRLILRGLHSVLNIPPEDENEILSHHASFLDFLNNPDRSGNFSVGILHNQISLARSLLQLYAAPFQRNNQFTLSNLIRFIVLLPPSSEVAELSPLIGSINPDYIANPSEYKPDGYFDSIICWLKNIPSAPESVIQLWEDYEFMVSLDTMRYGEPAPAVKHIISPSPELLHILISMRFLGHPLWELPTRLDLTWTDLRTTLRILRPNSFGDQHALPLRRSEAVYPWAARDLGLQLIRRMVKNHIDTEGGVNSIMQKHNFVDHSSRYDLRRDISLLVRLSPPCPVLYRELWSILPSKTSGSRPGGEALIHHVSKWLETFPDSMMELILFWQQAAPYLGIYRDSTFNPGLDIEEKYWHGRVEAYNCMIAGFHFPDSLRFRL
ncbi:putative nwd2 protein [Mycena sanguinolenta]|uniref:Putative nwd2 protein n=1 Tax=Mycena sanguinolenta TaxID=230812 RepID=A0A8H6Z8K2_9AGAR|nr:putative nwd2 protein [Mycena sanguinolenta]